MEQSPSVRHGVDARADAWSFWEVCYIVGSLSRLGFRLTLLCPHSLGRWVGDEATSTISTNAYRPAGLRHQRLLREEYVFARFTLCC